MSDVLQALQALDPQNDEHWTDQGLPRLAALSGKYTREQITLAAPGFNRETAYSQATEEHEDSLEKKTKEAKLAFDLAQEAFAEAKRNLDKVQAELDALIAQKPKPAPGSEIMAYLNAQRERLGVDQSGRSRLDRSMAGKPAGYGYGRPDFLGK